MRRTGADVAYGLLLQAPTGAGVVERGRITTAGTELVPM